jgi:mono/diheme cytochrome c family protein
MKIRMRNEFWACGNKLTEAVCEIEQEYVMITRNTGCNKGSFGEVVTIGVTRTPFPRQIPFLALVGLLTATPLAFAADPKPVDFAHEIVPIIKARCVECHADGKSKGGLSLDTRETMLQSKGAVTPSKPAESELIRRINLPDGDDERMPPKGDRLSAKEIALLTEWVKQGAKWEAGYTFGKKSYIAPLGPRVPNLPAAVKGRNHPIDRILDAYATKAKAAIGEPADDATFIRRASLDIVGLLPTPDETARFVKSREPEKRAQLIKDLLADNRRYTEHWLTFWNDLLRNDYSGTGYIDGGRKQITKWLYESLMANKPYDQFVRELIVPNLESEGFIRGIQWRGVVNASQVVELQFAQNVGQVFLGVNLKCASCHDSFIDSWKLTDAYGLAAVVAEKPLELHRCDKPLGQFAVPKFPFDELGPIDAKADKTTRLKRVAELLTSTKNGRFARTIVNRVWQRMMGRGIVEPVDSMAGEPWNEDLLDWLAYDFVVGHYDVKRLIARIATSKAYQSQSVPPPADGEPYVYHGPVRKRMTAEQFVDAVWLVTKTMPTKPHVAFKGIDRGKDPVRASVVDADLLMRSLGRPNREQVVTTRPDDLSTLQALDLTNGPILAEILSKGAKQLRKANASLDSNAWVDKLFETLLCRKPTPAERTAASALIGETVTDEGLADLLWAILAMPEFQTVR